MRWTRRLFALTLHAVAVIQLVGVGDGGYDSHELTRFAYLHQEHGTRGGRSQPQANLC